MDKEQAPAGSQTVETIPSVKAATGSIQTLPSKTEVYISANQGFKDICNYTFKIAGKFILRSFYSIFSLLPLRH